VPRVPETVNGVEMAGSGLPRRDLVDTAVTGMRLPAVTVRQLPVGEPWEGTRPIRRYEPDTYAPDPYAVPTLRVALLQSRLRELDLWAGVVGKYGDGHILDEETVVATILGLTAELNQARERADFAEEAVREVVKREREGKDDLEIELRRIRMAMEQVSNAAERLVDMVSRKRRRKE
jgi:Xaa-Pro aminopeptidase